MKGDLHLFQQEQEQDVVRTSFFVANKVSTITTTTHTSHQDLASSDICQTLSVRKPSVDDQNNTQCNRIPPSRVYPVFQTINLQAMIKNQHLFKQDTWKTIQSLEGHRFLGQAASLIPTLVFASKADNTNKKYNAYFNKFILWCNLHNFPFLPADHVTVSLYISCLVQQKISTSVLDSHFYCINRAHKISLFSNPCDHDLVKMTYEGAKRLLSKPVNKKEPIAKDMLWNIVDRFGSDFRNLINLRICVLCLLGFPGFF